MPDRILNINRDQLLNALESGNNKGYVLFPEIRERKNIDRIKKHPTTSRMLDELVQYASDLGNTDIPDLLFSNFIEFSTSGNRLHYENNYFDNKEQLHSLIMAELINDDGRFVGTIEDRLWKWCDTYTWELPAHVPLTPEAVDKADGAGADVTVALFSAETAFYFSEIISLIGNRLNPLLVYRLRKEIERRVVRPYINRTFDWEKSSNNWASVCAGAVGCTAIYTISDNDLLSSILFRIINAMECFLSGFDKDGVTPEGLTYWSYGFSFFVYFSELLKERTCGEINLLNCHEKLCKIAELPLYLHFPDGHMINFSDAPGYRWEGDYGLFCRLSGIFNIEDYRLPKNLSLFYDHTSKWSILSRNLFWGLDTCSSECTKTGMFYFPDSQWLIDRRLPPGKSSFVSKPQEANSCEPVSERFCAFAAKGGNNDESHNHNDLGHFILFCSGDMLFADLGAPEYTKKYFGPERYEILHASSKGHSVPLINGHEQASGPEHAASVTECTENSGLVRYGLDLTEAYDIKELDRFHRQFAWNFTNYTLNIIDEFYFNKPGNNVQEVFLTITEPVHASPGELQIKGESSTASLFYDAGIIADIIREEFTDHLGRPAAAYRTVIHSETLGTSMKMSFTVSIR